MTREKRLTEGSDRDSRMFISCHAIPFYPAAVQQITQKYRGTEVQCALLYNKAPKRVSNNDLRPKVASLLSTVQGYRRCGTSTTYL